MTQAILIIILLLGIIIYYRKPHYYLLYWMVIHPILIPVLCFLGGISTDEDTYMVIHRFPGMFMYLNCWVLLDSVLVKKKKIQGLRGLFVMSFLLTVFYFFQSTLLSIKSPSYLYLNIKRIGVFVLFFIVPAINDKIRPYEKDFKKLLCFLIILETVGVLFNFIGVRFYRATFSTVREAFAANYCGTFQSGQSLGDFMAVIYLLLCYCYFCRKTITKKLFVLLTIMSMFCLFSAGSRMCFVIACLGLFMTVFSYQKGNRISLIVMLLIGYFGLSFLSNYNGGVISSNEGVNRIIEGLSSFTQAKKSGYDDNSTLRLSEKVLEDYLSQTPLIGLGLSSQGEDADVIDDKVSTVKNLMSDAHLAFMIIDIGILGIILYLLFLYQMFAFWRRHIPKDTNKTLGITFVFLIIFSITEEGFWDPRCFPIFLVFYFSLMSAPIGEKIKKII